jgi:hypothetical protein
MSSSRRLRLVQDAPSILATASHPQAAPAD